MLPNSSWSTWRVLLRAVGIALTSVTLAQAVTAQGPLSGTVSANGQPVYGAQVTVSFTALRALTSRTGQYRIPSLPAGIHTIVVRAVGFRPDSGVVTALSTSTTQHDVTLTASTTVAEAIVTTGTQKASTVSESPVKIEVFNTTFFKMSMTDNVTESIKRMNGLQVQQDCGVCGTNNIQINGMQGPYTAILIDGSPIMGNLANVYGLNGINPAVIQQIEVVKGPASTLYGTEAMGGVINVITKDARFAPRATLNAFATSDGESTVDASATFQRERVQSLLSGSFSYNDRFIDRNADGFGDLTSSRRLALFNKWTLGAPAEPVFSASAKYYNEDRLGGVRGWTSADRCGSSRYGESIRTRRGELVGRYRLPIGAQRTRLDFSASYHDQNSCYGTTRYNAQQGVYLGQLVWDRNLGAAHDVLAGLTARFQTYSDNTPITANGGAPEQQFIPGVFAQDEVHLSPRVTLLGGLRVDHHQEHGFITSPRLALKWEATHHQTLRLNASTGFRLVNLFSEDHAAISGVRRLQIEEQLRPERSYNATLNYHAELLAHTRHPVEVDVDGFYTHFTNKIAPDYDSDPDATIYRNLNGYAETRGVATNVTYAPNTGPLSFNVGGTLQEVFLVQDGARRQQEFSPRFTGVFGASFALARAGLTVDWSGRVVSPQDLPACFDTSSAACADIPTRGPWYTEQTVQLTKRFTRGIEAYAGVKNLFGVQVQRPVFDASRPFADDFQTNFVWGPVQGRRVQIGTRYALSR